MFPAYQPWSFMLAFISLKILFRYIFSPFYSVDSAICTTHCCNKIPVTKLAGIQGCI